jgi:hypothetical protein
MRFPGQFLDLLVPPVLQDLLHVRLVISSSWALFEAAGGLLGFKATVVCAGGGGEVVYLVHLFADGSALLEAGCLVDLEADV